METPPPTTGHNYPSVEEMRKNEERYKKRFETQITQLTEDYAAKLNAPEKEETKVETIGKAINYIWQSINKNKIGAPEEVNYTLVRRVFWDALKIKIASERGLNKIDALGLTPDISGNLPTVLPNLINWLIQSKNGDYPINKGLWIWGDLGTGKTTIIQTAAHTMAFFWHRYGWEQGRFKVVSMDEKILELYSENKTDWIKKMATGFIAIDELREDHLTFKLYGNNIPLIANILTARYNLWQREGTRTIVTTNISPARLATVLNDPRAYDRVKQMFHTVEIQGKNKRHE
jgi:DNA replication protein DnaC